MATLIIERKANIFGYRLVFPDYTPSKEEELNQLIENANKVNQKYVDEIMEKVRLRKIRMNYAKMQKSH